MMQPTHLISFDTDMFSDGEAFLQALVDNDLLSADDRPALHPWRDEFLVYGQGEVDRVTEVAAAEGVMIEVRAA